MNVTFEIVAAAFLAAIFRLYFRYDAMMERANSRSDFIYKLIMSAIISVSIGVLLANPLTAWFGWSIDSAPFVALLLSLTAENLMEKIMTLSNTIQLQNFMRPTGYYQPYESHYQNNHESNSESGSTDIPDDPDNKGEKK